MAYKNNNPNYKPTGTPAGTHPNSVANRNTFSATNQPKPHGRPKGVENTRTRLKRLLSIIQKAKNPITGEVRDYTTAELMDLAVIHKVLKTGDVKAYSELLDR